MNNNFFRFTIFMFFIMGLILFTWTLEGFSCTAYPFRYEKDGSGDFVIRTMTKKMSNSRDLSFMFGRGLITSITICNGPAIEGKREFQYRGRVLNKDDWRVVKAKKILNRLADIIEKRINKDPNKIERGYALTYYIEINSITGYLDPKFSKNEEIYKDIVRLFNEERGSLCPNSNPFEKKSETTTKT